MCYIKWRLPGGAILMFGVIIPVYNCERSIRQVLDSVKRQTRFDLVEEIIVLNDGSTDRIFFSRYAALQSD